MRLHVRLTPHAIKTRIRNWKEHILFVSVQAPPVRDAANRELLGFLEQVCRISSEKMTIVAGKIQKNKVIDIPLSDAQVEANIVDYLRLHAGS